MQEVSFYGVLSTTKEKALIKLLEKTIEVKKRSIVFAASLEYLTKLDDLLWVSSSWLPHALVKDPYKEKQLILLSNELGTLHNNPNYMFIVDQTEIIIPPEIERAFIIFDKNVKSEVEFARNIWKSFNNSNYNVKYFQQDKEGKFNSVNL